MSEPVLVDVADGIAKLVLNRPEVGNAINEPLGDAFIAGVDRIAADRSVRAVLFTGAGKMFCAGGDLDMLREVGGGLSAHMQRTVQPMHDAMLKLARLPVPVVCALNGPAGGGGMGFAFCADLILAAESAKFNTGYSLIGLSPDFGVSWFLTRQLGPARAKEVMLRNQSLSARDCLALGLVNAVYPDDELMGEADALVRRFAVGPTVSLGKIKTLVNAAVMHTLEDHMRMERANMIEASASADGMEGVAAFIEKRRPRFSGH